MATAYYLQSCPTCGRRLQIRVEYLGRKVVCYHCRAMFVAQNPDSQRHVNSDAEEILRRVDELLNAGPSKSSMKITHPK